MDFLPDLSTLSDWLVQYGSLFLFFLLALGIIVFPVPEETLMVVTGVLMHHDKLPIPSTLLAAYSGTICGITGSYLIGKSLGLYFITKYGKWIGLPPKRLQKAHRWFERFGKWALCIGYFIPGIRHFTGLSAGITKLKFKQFAVFAYTGAFIWVSFFLSIGYFFGPIGLNFYEELELTADSVIFALTTLTILIALGFATYPVFKRSKKYPSKNGGSHVK